MTVIDTDFLIDLQQEDPRADALWSTLLAEGEPVRVPAVVWLEYLSGFDEKHQAKAVGPLERTCVFEPFEREMAELGAALQNRLTRGGGPLSWSDVQVAATGLWYREPLVTNDSGFDRVPGLRIRNW